MGGLKTIIFLFSAFCCTTYAATCGGDGWFNRGEKKCINIIQNLLTQDEAKGACKALFIQGVDIDTPKLLEISTRTEQEWMTNFIYTEYNAPVGVWLGAERLGNSTEFKWSDDSKIEYTNWAADSPSNNTARVCVEMDSGLSKANAGQWRDVTCIKGNWAVCQKTPVWSIPQIINELIKLEEWKEDISK